MNTDDMISNEIIAALNMLARRANLGCMWYWDWISHKDEDGVQCHICNTIMLVSELDQHAVQHLKKHNLIGLI